jgi:glycosyltransferase involved in cell wall biosynthesis
MKLLIITENIGQTAPGIVFEKLIQGLSVHHEVTILVANFESSIDLSKVKNVIISRKLNIHQRIFKLLTALFGVNPYDLYWSVKSIRKLNKLSSTEFDIILSFISFHHYKGLIAGHLYSKNEKIKHAVHSLDAIPPPGWPENRLYSKGVSRFIRRYLGNVDIFFTTNHQMLDYQLGTFKHKIGLITNVIYNPGQSEPKIFSFNYDELDTYNFVYTGGIYHVRKAVYIIAGFQRLLKSYPNSKLQFLGSQLPENLFSMLNGNEYKKIEIIPFTKNLDSYYEKATALIDIDAAIDNDVFLSSKMPNYLMINRIIICETGINSTSRHLFQGINSIIQCDHNADQLCLAMKMAIKMRNTAKYDDRNQVVKLFKLENIINELNKSLADLCNSDNKIDR